MPIGLTSKHEKRSDKDRRHFCQHNSAQRVRVRVKIADDAIKARVWGTGARRNRWIRSSNTNITGMKQHAYATNLKKKCRDGRQWCRSWCRPWHAVIFFIRTVCYYVSLRVVTWLGIFFSFWKSEHVTSQESNGPIPIPWSRLSAIKIFKKKF